MSKKINGSPKPELKEPEQAAVVKNQAKNPEKRINVTHQLDLKIPLQRVRQSLDDYGLNYEINRTIEPYAARVLKIHKHGTTKPVPPVLARGRGAHNTPEHAAARAKYEADLKAYNSYKSAKHTKLTLIAEMVTLMDKLIRKYNKPIKEPNAESRRQANQAAIEAIIGTLKDESTEPKGFQALLGKVDLKNPVSIGKRRDDIVAENPELQDYLEMVKGAKQRIRVGPGALVVVDDVAQRVAEELLDHACHQAAARAEDNDKDTAERVTGAHLIRGEYEKLSTYALWANSDMLKALLNRKERENAYRLKMKKEKTREKKNFARTHAKMSEFVFQGMKFEDHEVKEGWAEKRVQKDAEGKPRYRKNKDG